MRSGERERDLGQSSPSPHTPHCIKRPLVHRTLHTLTAPPGHWTGQRRRESCQPICGRTVPRAGGTGSEGRAGARRPALEPHAAAHDAEVHAAAGGAGRPRQRRTAASLDAGRRRDGLQPRQPDARPLGHIRAGIRVGAKRPPVLSPDGPRCGCGRRHGCADPAALPGAVLARLRVARRVQGRASLNCSRASI